MGKENQGYLQVDIDRNMDREDLNYHHAVKLVANKERWLLDRFSDNLYLIYHVERSDVEVHIAVENVWGK